MQKIPLNRVAAVISLALGLSACAPLRHMQASMDSTDRQLSRGQKAIDSVTRPSPVTEMSGQWINPVPIARQNLKQQLPPCPLTYNRSGAVSLHELLAFINRTCHIPVNVTPDALSVLSGTGASATSVVQGKLPPPSATGEMMPLASMSSSGRQSSAAGIPAGLHGVAWQGSLSGFMDNITTRLGLSWRYKRGRISVFYTETRNFPVLFMDSVTDYRSNTVSGTTSSSGSSGSSSGGLSGDVNTEQKTTTTLKSTLYKDINETVKSMLTPGVGRAYLSAGVLTVTDTPEILSEIEHYVSDRNKELNRQVVLNVEVLSLNKYSSDQVGIDWNMIFSAGDITGTLTSALADTATSAVTGSATILNGRLAGSKAFIEALSQQGSVSIVTQEASTTTNLSAVPIQVGTQQDYADSVTNEDTANVGSSTSISKTTVTTGFNMTVLPYILPGSNQVQLQASFSMSDDPTFRTFTSGNSSTELMKTKMRVFNQRTMLKMGQTLVLSGFQQMNDSVSKEGVGSPSFWPLGGGGDTEKDHSMLVILITPTLLE